jgi:DNA-binding response OmpR family regulator
MSLPAAAHNAEKVLLVDDNPRMQKILRRLFLTEGYQVCCAGDGLSALDTFAGNSPSAVVLDLMLPGMSGRDVCRELKKIAPETPIVVLSAITEVSDKVLLLEMGADDYVTKPFSPRELLARVQAALRRARKPAAAAKVTFGDCEVDFLRMTVTAGGRPVRLTAHELKLLRYLVEHRDCLITREELLNNVWGYNYYPTTRTVDNQIMKLRQKLEADPSHPVHFVTLHGAGYKFVV